MAGERTNSHAEDLLARATASEDDASAMPSAVVIFAHPDDETVALGGRLGRFQHARLVHATDGAPQNEQDSRAQGFSSLGAYRRARQQELALALLLAGLSGTSRECLQIPDQQASLQLAQLTRHVVRLLATHRPEVVFTHPYEGGHPDHDACAFAVQHAVAILSRGQASPVVVESTFYHAGPEGIATGFFLPSASSLSEITYALTGEEKRRKRALMGCFATQQETLRYFPTDTESFRLAPNYDFRKPPHVPPVFYDRYAWGMTCGRFCELAQDAEDTLREEMVAECT
ncbi:MAG TPA: PIG-L family deacetylase [Acidobacteriaceae bacterium]|nr:PIG-L family deacetylase [Acidobacteriaceae bacterium]